MLRKESSKSGKFVSCTEDTIFYLRAFNKSNSSGRHDVRCLIHLCVRKSTSGYFADTLRCCCTSVHIRSKHWNLQPSLRNGQR